MIPTGDDYDNSGAGRTGNWQQVFSGRQFWPLDPRPAEISIEDIAHALSNLCRFGGHCERFYSVAEHSVHVSHVVPASLALVGLLHDATEAYAVDIPRPLKPALSGYKQIEHNLWLAIASRYGLAGGMPDEVKAADNAVLLAEQKQIMKSAPAPWCIPGEAADVAILCLAPNDAKQLFLERFAELTRSRG
jgi:hypothetical protein